MSSQLMTASQPSPAMSRSDEMPVSVDKRFVALAARLRHLANGKATPLQAIGILSVDQGAGVTSLARNLAAGASRSTRQDILLVDADVERSSLAESLNVGKSPGLTEVVDGTYQLAECIRETQIPRVRFLPAGAIGGHAALDPMALASIIQELRDDFAWIIVDLPPAAEIAGGVEFASTVDGIVMVVEAERTLIHDAVRAKHQLDRANANVVGVVYNKARRHIPRWLDRQN